MICISEPGGVFSEEGPPDPDRLQTSIRPVKRMGPAQVPSGDLPRRQGQCGSRSSSDFTYQPKGAGTFFLYRLPGPSNPPCRLRKVVCRSRGKPGKPGHQGTLFYCRRNRCSPLCRYHRSCRKLHLRNRRCRVACRSRGKPGKPGHERILFPCRRNRCSPLCRYHRICRILHIKSASQPPCGVFPL